MIHVQGIIRGNQIDLDRETGLPSGSVVDVRIERRELSLDEKLRLVDSLCGVWAGDVALKAIFEDIERLRAFQFAAF